MLNRNNFTFILAVVAMLLLFLNLKQCRDKKNIKDENARQLSNIEALKDTVRKEKNKAGEIQFSRQSLVVKNGELEELNKDLHDEVKKQKGKVVFIQSSNGQITGDTSTPLDHQIEQLSDTVFVITSTLEIVYDSNNFKDLKVLTTIKVDSQRNVTVLGTKLDKDNLGFNIITGVKEENGKLRIFIRSDYPGLEFTKIDGAVIDPTKSEVIKSFFPKKKWSIGPQIGGGVNSNLEPGFYIGIGLSYNLFSF